MSSNLFTTNPITTGSNNNDFPVEAHLQPRVGTLFPCQSRQLKTPNYIIGSVRGSTPHLTPDLVKTLPQYNAMQISLGEVHALHPALQQYQNVTQSSKPYHDMLVLPSNHCIALGLRNPTSDLMYVNKRYNPTPGQVESEAQFPYQLSAKIAATRSETGAVRVTPQQFLEKTQTFSPDFLLLGGQDSDIDETKSRAEKTMRRNLEWVDQLYLTMASQPHLNANGRMYRTFRDLSTPQPEDLPTTRPLLVAPLEGGSHLDKRTRNGGVVSRKGTPSWQHAEEPKRDQFQTDADFAVAQTTYQDKITNDGHTVQVLPDGYHLGGLGTAVDTKQRREMIQASMGYILKNDETAKIPSRLRMATITGEPSELIDLIGNGIDLVSVTYPQILAEEGLAMKIPITTEALREALSTTTGQNIAQLSENDKLHEFNIMNLRDERYVEDPLPIDPSCTCYACKHHSRSYLNHLLNTREMLAEVLLMLHNTHQYSLLFQNMRNLIEIDTLNQVQEEKEMDGDAAPKETKFEEWAELARQIYISHGLLLHRNARNRNYVHHDPAQKQ